MARQWITGQRNGCHKLGGTEMPVMKWYRGVTENEPASPGNTKYKESSRVESTNSNRWQDKTRQPQLRELRVFFSPSPASSKIFGIGLSKGT